MELMDVLDMAGRVAVFGAICFAVVGVVGKIVARAHRAPRSTIALVTEPSSLIDPMNLAPAPGLPPEALYDRAVAMQYGIGDATKLASGGSPLFD